MRNQKLYKFYDRLHGNFQTFVFLWDINIFSFSDFVYAPGLSSIDINQSSKYFKNWFYSHENRRSSVDKNGVLNRFKSRDDTVVLLTFMISKDLSNIKQNSDVPAASAGQLLDKTLLTVVLNTCAANLTFITEYRVK